MNKVRFRKHIVAFLVVALCASAMGAGNGKGKGKSKTNAERTYKNIIFMIPDGCSQSIQTLARWYKGEDLTVDSMNAGMVRIDMANSVITGSAAAATAFATGHKTTVRFLGVGPRGNDLLSTFEDYDPDRAYAPMASILEMAKAKSKSTGLVATSRITHATPAAFACHIVDRGMDNEIMEHMVYNGMDVVLGGARRHLLPTEMGGKRTDGENLEQVLIDRGYNFVTTKAEMDAVAATPGTKVWGAFNMSHMDAEIDRPIYNPEEPSLSEMTAKAIEVLSQNPRGFFLMVEGSQVDWAGHNNDPAWMVTDFIEFDNAVKVAVDFAKTNSDTLIIAFPDHNTGGMKIGQYNQQVDYTATKVGDLVDPIKGMEVTAESLVAEMNGDYSDANMFAVIKTLWNIEASPETLAEINDLAPSVGLAYAIARVISQNYTVLGWTTHGHNGEDVPVWVYPHWDALGTIDNTDLAQACQYWGGLGPDSLDKLSEMLYVNVEEAFPGEWTIDTTDAENPVLVVREHFRLPISKDMLSVLGVDLYLGSLVVSAPLRDGDALTIVQERVYIPRLAVNYIEFLTRYIRFL